MTLKEVRDKDFHGFLQEAANRLSGKEYTDEDINEVVDYLLENFSRDKAEIRSKITLLIIHLIKWKYQPERRSLSWQRTIFTQRVEVENILGASKNLRNYAEDEFLAILDRSKSIAASETGKAFIKKEDMPELSLNNILDDAFVSKWVKGIETNSLYARSKKHKGSHKRRNKIDIKRSKGY